MNKLLKSSVLAAVILLPQLANGQSEITLGAQYKPRYEYRNGFKAPILEDQNPASFVEQRARLWANFQNEKYQIHINLQDVRMWGSTDQIYKTDPSLFNAYEAYAAYFFNSKWSFTVGRQAWDYDNARFLGNLDWAMQGRSHDGLLFKYNNQQSNFQLHFGGAYNQFQNEPSYLIQNPYANKNYKNMVFVWLNKDWGALDVSFLLHNDGQENNAGTQIVEYHRQTIAAIPSYHAESFDLTGEFYYQFGKNKATQDVSAYFVSAYATFKTKLTPITIGAELASGTAYNAAADVDNSWNPLYGTNHKFYGYMDYFYVGNFHGQAAGRPSGLIDINLKTNFKLNDKNTIALHVHQFISPVEVNDMLNPQNTLSSNLGTEVDLVYGLLLTKGVNLNVGYSQMFITDSMKNIKGIAGQTTGMNNWAWVQLNFNGDLFTFKK